MLNHLHDCTIQGGYKCQDGSCLSTAQVCDFKNDCQLSEDEKNCGTCNFDDYSTDGEQIDSQALFVILPTVHYNNSIVSIVVMVMLVVENTSEI